MFLAVTNFCCGKCFLQFFFNIKRIITKLKEGERENDHLVNAALNSATEGKTALFLTCAS